VSDTDNRLSAPSGRVFPNRSQEIGEVERFPPRFARIAAPDAGTAMLAQEPRAMGRHGAAFRNSSCRCDEPLRQGSDTLSPMFIPLGTNLDSARRPLVVYAVLALNSAIYALTMAGFRGGNDALVELFDQGAISLRSFAWWQPVTYQFLHDPSSILHVLSNMVFLWAFGGVVESRLGHLGFLALYLVGGALSGLLQVGVTGGSAVGASGSVSVVAGAFLALHPRGIVHGLWLLPPMRIAMPAAWLLGLYAAIDLVNTFTDLFGATRTGVGTIAHLGGLVFGLAVCVAMLGLGLLRRNDYDLFFLMKQWKRRRDLRAATAQAGVGVADGPVAARVRADGADTMSPKERTLRNTIAAAHRERDGILCASLYREILALNPSATLPAQIQLDVANQLASEDRAQEARMAYANFAARFRTDPSVHDARLMIAVLSLRRLGDARGAMAALAELDRNRLDGEKAALAMELEREAEALLRAGTAP